MNVGKSGGWSYLGARPRGLRGEAYTYRQGSWNMDKLIAEYTEKLNRIYRDRTADDYYAFDQLLEEFAMKAVKVYETRVSESLS